jgi:hypothetical protein
MVRLRKSIVNGIRKIAGASPATFTRPAHRHRRRESTTERRVRTSALRTIAFERWYGDSRSPKGRVGIRLHILPHKHARDSSGGRQPKPSPDRSRRTRWNVEATAPRCRRRDLPPGRAANSVRPRRQSTAIVVGETQPPSAKVTPQEPVLFDQVRDGVPLPPVQPTGQHHQHHLQRGAVVTPREPYIVAGAEEVGRRVEQDGVGVRGRAILVPA